MHHGARRAVARCLARRWANGLDEHWPSEITPIVCHCLVDDTCDRFVDRAAIGSSTAKSGIPGDYLTKFLISARNNVF